MLVTAVTITMPMHMAIMAYSIAVAPLVSAKNPARANP
jgi:hypothetical protein